MEKLGVEGFRGVDYTQQWCCGPYLIEEFVSDNSKRFIRTLIIMQLTSAAASSACP